MRKIICAIVISVCAFAGCGKSISDAQNYSPNNAPAVAILSVTNLDGSEIDLSRIVSYATYRVTATASDPDNDTLTYSFSSACGSFSTPVMTAEGCTVNFKTGTVRGGQEVAFSVAVSDSNGGAAAASYDIGKGKLDPSISVAIDKMHIKSSAVATITVTANCRGTFIVNPNIDGTIIDAEAAIASFKADRAGARLAYPAAGTETEITLAGPKSSANAKFLLTAPIPTPAEYDMTYNVWVTFADALGQADAVCVPIHVDDVKPVIMSNTATAASGSVSTSPAIDIVFNEDMDQESLESAVLSVTTAVSGASSGTGNFLNGSYNSATHTATYLVTGLTRNTAYVATLTGVTDRAGNAIASANSFSFTTTPTCSVSYNANTANSGSVPAAAANYLNGQTVTVKGNTGSLAKNGCTFIGWNTRSDGTGTTYTADNTFIMGSESVTLFAKWAGIEFTVTDIVLNGNSIILTVSALSSLLYDNVDVSVKLADGGASAGTVTKSGSNTITLSDLASSTEYAIVLTAKKGITAGKTISLCLPTLASGTQVEPVLIYTVDDLVNKLSTSGTYVLMNDIDMKKNVWTPTGSFTGTFYGSGKTISNFTLASAENMSFFGSVGSTFGSPGTVTRLSLDISGWKDSVSQTARAVLAYLNYGTISKCSVVGGSMTATQIYAGGLVGANQTGGVITDCYTTCNVTVNGTSNSIVGGLAGFSNGTIENCYATGTVSGGEYVGGLVGQSSANGTIVNCYATGDVSGSQYVGGLVGVSTGPITRCHATGAVSGSFSVGGLAGNHDGDSAISLSYATGNVSGGSYVGGLVGRNYFPVINCYTMTGTVTGSDYVGGLIGQHTGVKATVSYCYSASGMVSTNSSGLRVGGFAGVSDAPATGCYYDIDTTGRDDSNAATGLTKNNMIDEIRNNSGWLETIWIKTGIGSQNSGYPYLKDNVPR